MCLFTEVNLSGLIIGNNFDRVFNSFDTEKLIKERKLRVTSTQGKTNRNRVRVFLSDFLLDLGESCSLLLLVHSFKSIE